MDDLLSYPMVIREPGSGHRRTLDEALAKIGFQTSDFPIGLEAGSTEAVKNAVRSGLGYSYLSKYALQIFEREQLTVRQVEGLELSRGFYFLCLRNKPLSTAADIIYQSLVDSK